MDTSRGREELWTSIPKEEKQGERELWGLLARLLRQSGAERLGLTLSEKERDNQGWVAAGSELPGTVLVVAVVPEP